MMGCLFFHHFTVCDVIVKGSNGRTSMHANIRRRTVSIGIALLILIAASGFAGYAIRSQSATSPSTPTRTLLLAPSPASLPNTFELSEHAAQLANDKCEQEFGLRPFQADTFKLSFAEDRDRYEWGRLDPVGVNGYSARVSFNREGRDALVSVYWSVDSLSDFEVNGYSEIVEGGALETEGLTNSIKPD